MVRLASLGTQPGGLYPDEAAEGWDAHRLLHEPGFHPIFFDDDGGREGLFAYVVAAAFKVAGESATTLRAVSALVGVAGVVATFLALRRLGSATALVAMAWSAGSLWLIAISRDGMRNVLVPLFGAIAVGLLLRWAAHPGRTSATLAGTAVGAGLWTYQPLKLLPLLTLGWAMALSRTDPGLVRRLRGDAGWFVAALLLVAAPMVVTAVVDPGGYFGRAAAVAAFAPGQRSADLLEHTLRTLGMLTIVGDPNPRHNVAGIPLLGPPPLAWPLAGLAALGAWHAWRSRSQPPYSLILIGIPVFLLPPLVAVEGGAPHFLRSLGLAPFLAALIGLGAVELVQVFRRRGRWAARGAALATAALLAGGGGVSAGAYFSRSVSDRYDAYSFALVALAAAASGGPGSVAVVDDFGAPDVEFLDAARPPLIVAPGTHLALPGVYSRIAATSQEQIAVVAGTDLAARATVYARDPGGRPAVWVVTP